MKRFAGIFLLALVAPVSAQEKSLRFPSLVPKAAESFKLTADFLYVIEADAPHLVLASPNGLVNITEEVGPLRIRAKFVDGSGKSETRIFTGKQIWIVEAVGTGKVEVLAIPAGATKAAQVTRKTLDVEAGKGPLPPPKGKIAAHATYIGAEKTAVSRATQNDLSLDDLMTKAGIKVHALKADSPKIITSGFDEIVKELSAPCFIVQDKDGNIIGQARMGTTAEVWAYMQAILRSEDK